MPVPTPSTDHLRRGLEKLLQQYKGKARIEGVLTSYLNRIQELEDAIAEFLDAESSIENREGVWLDQDGSLVGRGRDTLTDAAYRQAIACKIRINRSSGTAPDLEQVLELSTPEGTLIDIQPYAPHSVICELEGDSSGYSVLVAWDNLYSAREAAVRLFLVYSDQATDVCFTLADLTSTDLATYADTETDDALGLGDAIEYDSPGDGEDVGGYLVSVIGDQT